MLLTTINNAVKRTTITSAMKLVTRNNAVQSNAIKRRKTTSNAMRRETIAKAISELHETETNNAVKRGQKTLSRYKARLEWPK